MIPSETNRPPDEVDTVIVTLTPGGMIPSETNRLPDEVDTVIVTLTTWGDDTLGD